MEVTFHNLEVTVSAETPEEAYTKLCTLLHTPGVEYTTDSFTTDQDPENEQDTEKLFPKE